MAKQRYKRVQAGRLVREVLWTPAFPCDTPKSRAEKMRCTSEARQKINDRYSWQKLKTVLACNFTGADIVATLTYDDEHLPASRQEARKLLKKVFAQLRAYRKARGEDFLYVYTTEDKHGDARIHHHVVLNGTGEDYEIIRSLWVYGCNVRFDSVDIYGYEELAKYMTKEPREYGHTDVGARTWTASINLHKPNITSEWVEGSIRLSPPSNASGIQCQSFENPWGSYCYIEYMLPQPPKVIKTRPRKAKTE